MAESPPAPAAAATVGGGKNDSRWSRFVNSLSLLLRQFVLILGKNFLLQIRRPIGSLFELIVPIVAVIVIVSLRFGIDVFQPEDKCFTTFPSDTLNIPAIVTDRNTLVSSFGMERVFYTYAPNQGERANRTADIMRRLGQDSVSVSYLSSQEEFDSEVVLKDFGNITTCFQNGAGIYFENLTGPDIKYSIRLRQNPAPTGRWETDERGLRAQPRGARISPNFYLNEGFMQLQKIVEQSIVEMLTNESVDIDVQVRQFPYPSYTDDLFLQIIDFILPLFIILAFIYSAAVFVKELVLEKETRIKETMKMMGLSNWVLVSTWFIKQALFYLLPVLLVSILLKFGRIFPASNLFLIFVFLLLYVISGIAFCFLISVWFSSARIGLMAAFIVWFIAYLPFTFMSANYESLPFGVKIGTCLISNTCVGFGTTVMSFLELRQDGLLFSNFNNPLSLDDPLHMGWIFFMLFLDTIIYMILYWYIDAVKPGQYGVPRPFYFIFQPSYWCGNSFQRKIKPEEIAILSMSQDPSAHEQEPTQLDVGISINRLTKIYNRRNKKRRKVAVDNLSLNMYKGQITALLGHNGAGKTTTMSILTGLFTATTGGARINGYDIANEMDLIRRSLGICPQHNVLFDRLTVREHLAFFSMLKGLPTNQVNREVDNMITDLQLADKRGVQSQKLSGGMKRKLSVGIALVGGSEIVVLDEPTSGMDPYARRATWDLLVKHKQGRTMLLTTHFMDEADLLGDRIAIMAEGKLKCSGSSLFLKGRYGVGYHMTMVKEADCDSMAVTKLVTSSVSGAEQVTDVGAELSFILPSSSINQFPDLFDLLDNQKQQLGISSFGVSITTMEEVFIKVGEGTDETLQSRLKRQQESVRKQRPQENAGLEEVEVITLDHTTGNAHFQTDGYDDTETQTANMVFTNKDVETPSNTPSMKRKNPPIGEIERANTDSTLISRQTLNTGVTLWFQQFCAMFMKRLYNSIRFWVSIIWQFILPVAFVLWALVLAKTLPGFNSDEPPRALTIEDSAESNNHTFFYAQFGDGNSINMSYVDNLGITDYFDFTAIVNNTRASVNGVSSIDQCCGYKNQILDKFCASRNASEFFMNNEVCGSDFGYRNCPNCLKCTEAKNGTVDSCTNPLNREVGDSRFAFVADICPAPPSVSLSDFDSSDTPTGPLDDYNVFIAEELLKLSGETLNTNDFFLRYQGGFVLHPSTSPYSVCSCVGTSQQDLCEALSPAQSINTDGRENNRFARFANFTVSPTPERLLQFWATCNAAFNDTCTEEYDDDFSWTVNSCIQLSGSTLGCTCTDDGIRNCSQMVGATTSDQSTMSRSATVWYNNQPFHMAPAALNSFHNILLRQNDQFRDYTITVTNNPLPRDLATEIDDADSEFLGFTISSTTAFGLSFLYASFIIFLVQEKYSKAKHLQFVSGVSATSYWLSTYVFDLINALLPILLTFFLFAVFRIDGFKGENLAGLLILLLFTNWASIPITYCFSFVFSNALLAFALMFVFFYFIALAFLVVVFVLQSSDPDLSETLHYVFLIHPMYGMAIGITDMYTNEGVKEVCTRDEISRAGCAFAGVDFVENIFDFKRPGIGHIILYLFIEGLVFMLFTLLAERSFFIPELRHFLLPAAFKNGNGHDVDVIEDSDVAAERIKVAEMSALNSDEAVVIKNLVKLYRSTQSVLFPCVDSCQTGNKLAVNQINLVIPRGECFGLLGVNGAGKTTTFKMLTGDITPSAGTAKLAGFDINTQLRLVQQRIGYCPQFDAVLERLTGRELLTMFARLRGIPEKDIKQAVATEINRLDLVPHANKRCGTYSGGNKRKLSTAVALVGNPPILLLDEPTTGMDPATRRFLWDALTGVIREGRSVILTSHSMEECEALCTRLAIMVNGQFKCLGSIQHLKSKFGSGYTLQIKISPNVPEHEIDHRPSSRLQRSFRSASFRNRRSESPSPNPVSPTSSISRQMSAKGGRGGSPYDTGPVHGFVNTNFPGSLLLEEHQGSVTYRVPAEGVTWSSLFKLIESNREALSISDYSVSQTTLDQVFINFAREQEEEF